MSRRPNYSFDREYLERLIAEDPDTERHFTDYFGALLSLKLRSKLRSPAQVEDARQETFARVLVALKKKGGLASPESLGAFVNSVCNNVLLESYRARGGDETLTADHGNVADDTASVEEAMVTGEMKAQVQHVLEQLDPKDAQLLRSVFLEERDKDAICREHGVDRDYLRVLIYRAKEKFRSTFLGRREVTRMKPRDTETGKPSLHH